MMRFTIFKNTVLLCLLVFISCASKSEKELTQSDPVSEQQETKDTLLIGANRTADYLPHLQNKRVGIVANQTSVIFKKDGSYTHLVDSLKSLNIAIKKVFAPEHGFRGDADAGEHVKDGLDSKTNLPIVSLYGENKKPNPAQLSDLDIVVFDIQDVGARFYTYISSLHYVMEACAEAGLPVVVLDRPNPNGHYVDGPILDLKHRSFVGMHPVPVVHGMTIGEYATMINGEGWLNNGISCDLRVIRMRGYHRNMRYTLPIKPSPNLPNDQAINLYPSLCFFEGTNVSAGRGTTGQFQVFGSPYLDKDIYDFKFVPQPNEGSKYPKHKGQLCYGVDLREVDMLKELNLEYLINAYNNSVGKQPFFNAFFTKLAGTTELQNQIEQGLSEQDIKLSWKPGLEAFLILRTPYLIYD